MNWKRITGSGLTLLILIALVWLAKDGYDNYNKPKGFNQEHQKYLKLFPDVQSVQLPVAKRNGVPAMKFRNEVSKNRNLTKVSSTKGMYVRPATYSQHYLVPKARNLLKQIGQHFADSLTRRNLSYERVVATSLTRSREDVTKLRKVNKNAVYNSAHMHGTTFDLSYNRWKSKPEIKKQILGNVLTNLRENNKCYVKYEVSQACFHITAR